MILILLMLGEILPSIQDLKMRFLEPQVKDIPVELELTLIILWRQK